MKIGVLGAGTWGMALARMLSNAGNTVTVWSAIEEELDTLDKTRCHKNLPGMVIPDAIVFTKSIQEACEGMEIVLFAVPSVFVRSIAKNAAPYITEGQIIVDVAKGIEKDTLLTMSEVISSEIHNVPVVALSGPTHAEEVAKDLPTTIVAAHPDTEIAKRVQAAFTNDVMRVYTNTDIKGVELCGALKNIIALASGISAGLGYGDNTKAAIITRGLAEMERLGSALNCLDDTFLGLAGMGDLIVTATSQHSRNNRCGKLIGQGVTPKEAVEQVGMVVEGINALPAAMAMAETYHVEMPITEAVNAVINHGANPKEEVKRLMDRHTKSELLKQNAR